MGKYDLKDIISRYSKRSSNIGYAIKILSTASKRYFILYWIITAVMAILPFITLYFWKELMNILVKSSDNTFIVSVFMFTILYCIFMLMEKFFNTIQKIVAYKYNDEIDYYIDNLLIDYISNADFSFFDSSDMKDKLNHVTSLMQSVTKNIPMFLFETLQMIIWCIISIIIISHINFIFPLIIILLSIPSILGNKKIDKRYYEFQKKHTTNERKMLYYASLFGGNSLFELKLYGLKYYFTELYTSVWRIVCKAKLKYSFINILIECMSVILFAIGDILTYLIIISKLITQEMGVGDITYYVSILSDFRWRFVSVFNSFNELVELTDELGEIRKFLNKESVTEKCGNRIPRNNPSVEFADVSFKYPNSNEYILKNCSFTIEPNKIIGLVGLNGSGKSTIIKLLCRFYDPTEGHILIDGIDASEYDLVALRKLFSVLFQDYVSYSFSLRENVALSDIDRLNDNNAILEACDFSNVSDFIVDWENGIDTNMTHNFDSDGKELSGGQWQRVSLARAFFRNAPIVLLDEPSAALDPISEHKIFEDFKRIADGKSALLISHRLSSITLCDEILVLDNGYIIEQGSHDELMKKNGRYAYLFNLQAQKYL